MHRHGDAYPTTYFIVFVLGLELVFAENYVELQCFVTILSLIALQGSVCTHAR